MGEDKTQQRESNMMSGQEDATERFQSDCNSYCKSTNKHYFFFGVVSGFARELAMHATGGARDEGDERNGVIVSILSVVGVDLLL